MSGGAILPSSSRRARAARAEPLVDLEQERRAVGRADDRVRLEQLALVALERRSRGSPRSLSSESAAPDCSKSSSSSSPSGKRAADERAARRSRGSSRRASRASRARSCRRGSGPGRGRRAGRSPPGRARTMQSRSPDASTMPPGRADALVGEPLGLVDRDAAQREEPADDDHGDRGEAAEHEARDGRGHAWRRPVAARPELRPMSH